MGVPGFGPRLVAVLLTILLGGCAAGTPVTGSGTRATAPVGPAPTTFQRTPPPTNPAPTPSLAAAIREWEAVAGDHFTQSARALEKVSAAAGAGDDSAVRAACADLHDTNAVGLQGHLPTPDPALTAELQRMIDDVNVATHACLRFADGREPSDADNYQDYLARAVEHLHRAKRILEADLQGR
ncbi:MAG TPA: hypothetical protein PLK19_08090 [Mycobacterium sp.]|nr:hypothetical protein [Mycobacterium sp.]